LTEVLLCFKLTGQFFLGFQATVEALQNSEKDKFNSGQLKTQKRALTFLLLFENLDFGCF